MKWSDVQLYQFNKLQEVLEIENEEEKMIQITQILMGDDVINLPVSEFAKKTKELEFLKESIPTNVPPKKITVNGKKYFIDCLLGNVTTAQYIDFINHSKTSDIAKMLSAFIIPEGHKYNDGYDMMEVINDINNLPITVVNDIAFFFGRQFNTFIKIFQYSLIKKIKKKKIPKELKQELIQTAKNSMDLVSYRLF